RGRRREVRGGGLADDRDGHGRRSGVRVLGRTGPPVGRHPHAWPTGRGDGGMTPSLEIERQVVAAAERYREVAALAEVQGLPESGKHAAAKAVGRAIQLLSFVLKPAADGGGAIDRLREL